MVQSLPSSGLLREHQGCPHPTLVGCSPGGQYPRDPRYRVGVEQAIQRLVFHQSASEHQTFGEGGRDPRDWRWLPGKVVCDHYGSGDGRSHREKAGSGGYRWQERWPPNAVKNEYSKLWYKGKN